MLRVHEKFDATSGQGQEEDEISFSFISFTRWARRRCTFSLGKVVENSLFSQKNAVSLFELDNTVFDFDMWLESHWMKKKNQKILAYQEEVDNYFIFHLFGSFPVQFKTIKPLA